MNELKYGIYAGSFDPITYGHMDIIKRSVDLFDKLYILLPENVNKNYLLSLDERINLIKELYKDNPKIEVIKTSDLTVNICKELNVKYLVRGVRTYNDFEYEKTMASYNKDLNQNIETIVLIADPTLAHVSSSGVREIVKFHGDISKYVPKIVEDKIYNK